MSMEHGVSASTTKAAHGAHGAHGYGKNAAGAAGGFASVLSSLGAEEDTQVGFEGSGFLEAEKTHAQAAVPGAAESVITSPTGAGIETASGLNAFDLTGQEALNVDAERAEDVLGAASGTDESARAALAALGLDLAGVTMQGAGVSDAATTQLASTTTSGGVPGATALGGHVLGGGKAAAGSSTVGLAGGRATAQADRVDSKTAAKEAVSSTATPMPGKQSGAMALMAEAPGLQRQVGQRNLVARADAARADAVRGGKSEDVAARLGWRSEAAAQATQAALTAGVQQAALGDLGGGRFGSGERGEEGSRVTLHEFSTVGAVNTGPVPGSSLDPAALANPAPGSADVGSSAETQVAEQVSYWIGRGARNAEISVEGLAENPIHITIALQGQEASLVFRAEQVETRQVLQDAMPHLREMLEREGLTLGDVSVGYADPGWNGGSEASAHAREQAANRLRLNSLGAQRPGDEGAAQAQGVTRAVPLPAGRTLDLFV